MKGQAALEYLMTYGWAILIVIIIGVALYAMGVFNPGSFVSKNHNGLSAFTIIDQKATNNTTNSIFTVELSPRGHTFNINNVTATYGTAKRTCTSSSQVMSPSEEYNITCTMPKKFTTGGTYSNLKLTITYTDQYTGLPHTSTGTFSGKVE